MIKTEKHINSFLTAPCNQTNNRRASLGLFVTCSKAKPTRYYFHNYSTAETTVCSRLGNSVINGRHKLLFQHTQHKLLMNKLSFSKTHLQVVC